MKTSKKFRKHLKKFKLVDLYFLVCVTIFAIILSLIVKPFPRTGNPYIPFFQGGTVLKVLEIFLGMIYSGMYNYVTWMPFHDLWLRGRVWQYSFYSFVVGIISILFVRNREKGRLTLATIIYIGLCFALTLLLV